MLFNSGVFAAFFVIFFGIYWATRRHRALQNVVTCLASYVFYGWWDERFLILVIVSTINDYFGGIGASGLRPQRAEFIRAVALGLPLVVALALPTLAQSPLVLVGGLAFFLVAAVLVTILERLEGERRRKAYMIASVTINLSILGFFKYFNFFATSLSAVLAPFGIAPDAVTLDIILPVGISFYTFQTMSYTIDCYRRGVQPTRSLVDFSAYVAFFPQLVAGPIERAAHLLPQFQKTRALTYERIVSGAALTMWGLFKKVVVADNLGNVADSVFANPIGLTGATALAGVVAFALQIYGDFSGYSDMARGLARIIGFDLIVNFDHPYFSRTPSEFWRRWHISLSTWLRDYLYVSLGGNRKGPVRTYRNLLLTMLLGGLWHGAAWTFVVWGMFHGTILVIYRALRIDERLKALEKGKLATMAINGIAWAVMFSLVLFSWVFFRAHTFGDASSMLASFGRFGGPSDGNWALVFYYAWPLVVAEIWQYSRASLIAPPMLLRFARVNAALFIAYALIFLWAPGVRQFIYFDF
jgi:alginate O-acetyltransferase complex protein AlgI